MTIAGKTLTVTQAGAGYIAAGPTTLASSILNLPTGIAVDGAGNVYIADTWHSAIEEWNAATGTVTTLVSAGLSYPNSVAVDNVGNVYIADTDNNAIKEWHAATGTVTTGRILNLLASNRKLWCDASCLLEKFFGTSCFDPSAEPNHGFRVVA